MLLPVCMQRWWYGAYLVLGGVLLLRRVLLAHLAIVNDGSPTPDVAYEILDVTLAQAFYGQLPAGGADYYHCQVRDSTTTPLSLLIPQNHYTAGFHPVIRVYGTELPDAGLVLLPGDAGVHIGTTVYQRTQRTDLKLQTGSYRIEISSAQPGVYCFCIGSREPAEYADATTRQRVRVLLEG